MIKTLSLQKIPSFCQIKQKTNLYRFDLMRFFGLDKKVIRELYSHPIKMSLKYFST